MSTEISQNVNIGGINFRVEGTLTDTNEFYGTFTCNYMLRGEDDGLHPASEIYRIGKNARQRPYYDYYLSRAASAGGDETYRKSYDTYSEMRAGKFMLESVLNRIVR